MPKDLECKKQHVGTEAPNEQEVVGEIVKKNYLVEHLNSLVSEAHSLSFHNEGQPIRTSEHVSPGHSVNRTALIDKLNTLFVEAQHLCTQLKGERSLGEAIKAAEELLELVLRSRGKRKS